VLKLFTKTETRDHIEPALGDGTTASLAQTLDQRLLRVFGLPYLRLTREDSIHERLRYLVHVVRELGVGRFPMRILDVGCGSGLALWYLSRYCPAQVSSYIGIDLSTHRLVPRYSDVSTNHSFRDVNLDDDWHVGEVDLAWCSETLEHLVDDSGVFRKICRSVASSAHIVTTMPSRPHLESMARFLPQLLEVSRSQDGSHVRVGYDPSSLAALSAGTSASLRRVDYITRSDLAYLRRRYAWPTWAQPLNTWINALVRGDSDRFALNGSGKADDYLSIAAIYDVN
jgi:SAM-dependent methyltransferase